VSERDDALLALGVVGRLAREKAQRELGVKIHTCALCGATDPNIVHVCPVPLPRQWRHSTDDGDSR